MMHDIDLLRDDAPRSPFAYATTGLSPTGFCMFATMGPILPQMLTKSTGFLSPKLPCSSTKLYSWLVEVILQRGSTVSPDRHTHLQGCSIFNDLRLGGRGESLLDEATPKLRPTDYKHQCVTPHEFHVVHPSSRPAGVSQNISPCPDIGNVGPSNSIRPTALCWCAM